MLPFGFYELQMDAIAPLKKEFMAKASHTGDDAEASQQTSASASASAEGKRGRGWFS